MEIINDALGFLAGFIEQFEIGGTGDVGRRAGGIDEKFTAGRGNGWIDGWRICGIRWRGCFIS